MYDLKIFFEKSESAAAAYWRARSREGTSTMLNSASYFSSMSKAMPVSSMLVIWPERRSDCISRTESIMMPSGVAGFERLGSVNVTASFGVVDGGSLRTRVCAIPISTFER